MYPGSEGKNLTMFVGQQEQSNHSERPQTPLLYLNFPSDSNGFGYKKVSP